MEEAKSKKTKLGTAIGFLVAFGVTTFVINTFFGKYNKLVDLTEEINSTCPVTVDADTRLDSTAAVKKPLGLVYYYTIVTVDKDSVDVTEIEKAIKDAAQQNLDTQGGMKEFRDAGVRLRYHYRDKEGNPFMDFTIQPTKQK